MKNGINVLSLFDGMSCGQIALERAGIKVNNYYASEIDKYAIKVTQSNYPNTIQVGDITKLNAKDFTDIDLIIGGSPCQGFSFLGKQLNFKDERSKLFFEFVRLLKEIKPKYFLLENVKMKKEYQDIISESLNVNPININSSLVSAQLRNRLYWSNIENIEKPKDKNIKLNDILEYGKSERKKSLTLLTTYYQGSSFDAPECIIRHYKNKSIRQIIPCDLSETKWRILTIKEAGRLQNVPDSYLEVDIPNKQKYSLLGNGWTVDIIAHILKEIKNNF